MASDIILGASLDQILSNLSSGSVSRAISNAMYGFNARHKNAPIPRARDSYGYTFFTRPQLNLTASNISNHRRMFSMLTSNKLTYQRYTRMMLDPRLGYMGMDCPFVDNENAFIPLLSNSITSLSGFPDISLPTHTSKAGNFGEETSWADGTPNEYNVYELMIGMRNTIGSPVPYLLTMWVYYETLVYQGVLNPYIDMITENEIDYNTRIYRLVTDSTNKYITHIGATGAAYPTSLMTGGIFDFNSEETYTNADKDLSYRFKAIGFMFDEDVIKLEFNQTQAIFNPSIRQLLAYDMTTTNQEAKRRSNPSKIYEHQDAKLVKVPHALAMNQGGGVLENVFYNLNYNLYPYINLHTNELEWWTKSSNFKGV